VNKVYVHVLKEIENLTPQEIIEKINKTEKYICSYENGKYYLKKRHKRKGYEFIRNVGEFSDSAIRNLIKHITDYKIHF